MTLKVSIKNVSLKKKININNVKLGIKKVYPELENLEIIPSGFEQKFNHQNSYGYDEIIVKPVASDEINIIPSAEKQQYKGLFNTVNVEGVKVPVEDWYTEEVETWK